MGWGYALAGALDDADVVERLGDRGGLGDLAAADYAERRSR